ncbi:ATP-binding protein [Streptomyces sp. NPDC059002]|uniref:ATP-binding protein n=1 Tax=Streptomyces sp. NPDC059002 TaxID=3346690 RepID=UPI0036BC259D
MLATLTTCLKEFPYRHVLTMPTTPSAVRLSREMAEQAWQEWGVRPNHPAVGPALLILGELVTNSVRHAADDSPQTTVIYAGSNKHLAFGVHDRHAHQPSLSEAVTGSGARTRGLATVMELVRDLDGTAVVRGDADGQGKTIWITLPL